MKKTPLQNVIDRVENFSRKEGISNEEKRTLNMVTSFLWDEIENERRVISEVFDLSKKEHKSVSGKMWVNKHFIDYQKFL